jgi:mRNA-degrading endonuclease RelE of RelBE toxin-antitoxin system
VNPGPWRMDLTRSAEHDLRRLEPPVREHVADALRTLASDPVSLGALRTLTNAPESRLRSRERASADRARP